MNNKIYEYSPIIYALIRLQLNITPLIIMTEPFPPTLDESISLIILIVKFIAHSLGIPNKHIIIHLQSLGVEHDA
jgi:hypothetical protein